jgi:hypothetical protein
LGKVVIQFRTERPVAAAIDLPSPAASQKKVECLKTAAANLEPGTYPRAHSNAGSLFQWSGSFARAVNSKFKIQN